MNHIGLRGSALCGAKGKKMSLLDVRAEDDIDYVGCQKCKALFRDPAHSLYESARDRMLAAFEKKHGGLH